MHPFAPGQNDETSKIKHHVLNQNVSDQIIWMVQQHNKSFRIITRHHTTLMPKTDPHDSTEKPCYPGGYSIPDWTWSNNRLLSRRPWPTSGAFHSWDTSWVATIVVGAIMSKDMEHTIQALYTSDQLSSSNFSLLIDKTLEYLDVPVTWGIYDDNAHRANALYGVVDKWIADGCPTLQDKDE